MSSAFIGRTNELDTIRSALPDSTSGRGRFIAIAGEPGIGKTRLMVETARIAESRRLRVLWSQMIEDPVAPPYLAWLLLLRAATHGVPDELLLADAGSGAVDLADLVPELRDRLKLPPAKPQADAAVSRFQLFDAVTRFLLASADRQPLVLLFDNLHLADRSSVEMLEYYCQQITGSAVLAVAAYRDAELKQDDALRPALGRLARSAGYQRLQLAGLLRDEVAALLRLKINKPAPAALIDALYEQSDGNPLFVSEVGDELARRAQSDSFSAAGARFSIPESLTAVIESRFESLPPAASRLLGVAAVLGRDFDTGALAAIAGKSTSQILCALEPAETSGLVATLETGRFRFCHALFREVPYAKHGVTQRLDLHRRTAEYLEGRHADDPGSRIPELAYHCFQAAQAGLHLEAVTYCTQAGDAAVERRAYGEAANLYEQALHASTLQPEPDREQEFLLLLALGQAQYRAGQVIVASKSLLRAALLAHRRKWWLRLAEAILEFQAVRGQVNIPHVATIPLLQTALEHAAPTSLALHAKLLSSLAIARHMAGDLHEAETLFREGLLLARQCNDDAVLMECLKSLVWLREIPPRERTAMLREALEIARNSGRANTLLETMVFLPFPLCELGEIHEVETLLPELNQLVRTERHPHYRNVTVGFAAAIAILQGRWGDAILTANESVRQAPLQGVVGLEGRFGLQMFAIQRARGRLGAVAQLADRLIGGTDPSRLWLPGQILLHCELGQRREAKAALERLGSFSGLPLDDLYIFTLVYLAEACTWLRDAGCCRELLERLSPYRELNASVDAAVMLGAVAGFMAPMAAFLRRKREARKLFEEALRLNARMGALPALARNCVDYAELLQKSEREEDKVHARQLLGQAAPIAEALELKPVQEMIAKLEQQTECGQLTTREVAVLRLMAAGASNKKIASTLSISHNTVATHVKNILRKIGASNRTEAAEYARRSALLATAGPSPG